MEWYKCPECGKKLFPLNKDTKIYNLDFKCKGCKKIININVK